MDDLSAFHARERWRREEDPLVVEATEIASGWRHVTVRHPLRHADHAEFEALAHILSTFQRLGEGRPSAACGGTDQGGKTIVLAYGPPDAEADIARLYRLAQELNPGTWEISLTGRLPRP